MLKSLPSIVRHYLPRPTVAWLFAAWFVMQVAIYLLPVSVIWWLLALCGCPSDIALALASIFAAGLWLILWTTLD